MEKWYQQQRFHILVLLLLTALRLLYLQADLSFFKNPEDFTDEFWWAYAANFKLQTGSLPLDAESGPWAAGPLFTYFLVGWYKIFGPSLFSLRFLSWLAALINVFLLYRLCLPLGKTKAFSIALILSLVHSFFIYSRFMQIEGLHITLFLLIIFLIARPHKINWLLAGILAALAILLKFSFVPMVAAVLLYCFLGGSIRKSLGNAALFVSPIVFLYVVYEFSLAHHQLNSAVYFNAFSNIYYSFEDLLHPFSIPFRLMYLHQHAWFWDLSVLFILLIVTVHLFAAKRFSQQLENKTIAPLLEVSGIYLLLLLFTDFNERRMILLLPFIALAFVQGLPHRFVSIFKYGIIYVFSLGLLLFLLQHFPDSGWRNALLDGKMHYKISLAHAGIYLSALCVHLRKPNWHYIIRRIAFIIISLWLLLLLHFNLSRVFYLTFSFPLILLCIGLLVSVIILVHQSGMRSLRYYWIVIAFSMQIYVIANASFSVKESMVEFDALLKDAQHVAGDNVIYLASFHKAQKILAFTNSISDNKSLLLDQFKYYQPEIFVRLSHKATGPISDSETIPAISSEFNCSFNLLERIPLLNNIRNETVYYAEIFQVNYH